MHRRNFLCDGGDSHHHFFTCNLKFFTHCFFLWKIYVQILMLLFYQNLSASPHQGLCPRTPLGALPPNPDYRLALHALAICSWPLSPPLFGVKLRHCRYDILSWPWLKPRHWSIAENNDYTTSLITADVDTLATRHQHLTKRLFVGECCLRIHVFIICYQKNPSWYYAVQRHFNHLL